MLVSFTLIALFHDIPQTKLYSIVKRRTFCQISGLTAGSLFLPAPFFAPSLAPDEATRIFAALSAHSAGECPAHHHEGIVHLTLPLPKNLCKSSTASLERVGAGVPGTSTLKQNTPDRFKTTTTIPFALAEPAFVDLRVYNRWGQKVAALVEEHLPAGSYRVVWEAHGLAEGIYQYVLEAGSFLQARRMAVGAPGMAMVS